ncbi:hypothetical protein [Sphingomonas oligoaromativorans]|uniref:hypothetical protein n=1 Tax=Sphingomonas oligoaromativorans TaxID=575322 RepID=UPI001420B4BC|nr:hypothetical protein [Sphingomonas oligoaromativorans]NIJ33608.1 hypothetical protein [Sphingomonas oligoaromativorans]
MSDEHDWSFDGDDIPDEPYADPAIRSGYQNALGRFIMAHNEVDFWMSAILEKAVQIIAPDGALNHLALGDFSARATNLVLLMRVAPHLCLGGVGNGRLHELNGVRNALAHGHFDQDRYSGTFEIVNRKHKSFQVKRLKNLNEASINAAAEELEGIASHMEAVHAFMDVSLGAEYFQDAPVILKSIELWELMASEDAKKAAEAGEQKSGVAAPDDAAPDQ